MSYDIYAAFGNKVRVNLIRCLSDKSKTVTELINTCGLSQSAVSQHLRKLKLSRLVVAKKQGKTILYSLQHKSAAEIGTLLQHLERKVL